MDQNPLHTTNLVTPEFYGVLESMGYRTVTPLGLCISHIRARGGPALLVHGRRRNGYNRSLEVLTIWVP
jgi:hypothetical protein